MSTVHLNWDSDFLGFKVAKIVADENIFQEIKSLRNKDYKLIYIFAEPDDVSGNNKIKETGAKLVDEKAYFEKLINNCCINSVSDNISSYNLNYVDKNLLKLTYETGIYSRFKTDKKFQDDVYFRLYEQWIINSVNKKFADIIFVYREENHIIGYITLKIKNNISEIGLIGVDKNSRGKSIGSHLLNRTFAYNSEKGIEIISVNTQLENKIACEFYNKNGFVLKKITNIYHLWM